MLDVSFDEYRRSIGAIEQESQSRLEVFGIGGTAEKLCCGSNRLLELDPEVARLERAAR